MGTPPYMAPEILAGGPKKSGPASEVYALGAILFHLLTGRTPFTGTSATELLHLAINAAPPSPRLLNPAVPRDLETICLKCIEKSPESRYATARANWRRICGAFSRAKTFSRDRSRRLFGSRVGRGDDLRLPPCSRC